MRMRQIDDGANISLLTLPLFACPVLSRGTSGALFRCLA